MSSKASTMYYRRKAGAVLFAIAAIATPAVGNCFDAGNTAHPWERYIYAPSSREVRPVAIHSMQRSHGSASGATASAVQGQSRVSLEGKGAYVVLDFGREVAGTVSFDYSVSSRSGARVGLAFSESSLYVGSVSDQSMVEGHVDGALIAEVAGKGRYTMTRDKLRGGFRYLTLFADSDSSIVLSDIVTHFSADPLAYDLRAYPGYFWSDDELLNRIWYAGAYTVQLSTIDPATGHSFSAVLPNTTGWSNNLTVGSGMSVLVDAPKRDRLVWPGDIGIEQRTAYVSRNDMLSARNALDTLYALQDSATGGLPFVGPPVGAMGISDTYHMWTLLATADYLRFSGDKAWLNGHWQQYVAGLGYLIRKIGGNGLLESDAPVDWGRNDAAGTLIGGGQSIQANSLLYRTLVTGAALAAMQGDTIFQQRLAALAATLRRAVNTLLWDDTAGLFRESVSNTALHPQDGNSLAVWFDVADSATRKAVISSKLRANWNRFGAVTPERYGAIGNFPGSLEVQAHFAANDDTTGLALIRRQWGYMLNAATGTGSTFWEGFLKDGTGDYHGSYMSYAHGWATGPTSALTFYVLGLEPAEQAANAYTFAPHPGDLHHVEGALPLPGGLVSASWNLSRDGRQYSATVSAPSDIRGTIGVPCIAGSTIVRLDGRIVWDGRAGAQAATGIPVRTDAHFVYLDNIRGSHTIQAQLGE
jgi:hypothetical protein